MSVKITPEFTRGVAELARLELGADEARAYSEQLSEIVKYVEQLQLVDVSGIEPLMNPVTAGQADQAGVMREDAERPSLLDEDGRPRGLEAAPEMLNDGFKVPPIL